VFAVHVREQVFAFTAPPSQASRLREARISAVKAAA